MERNAILVRKAVLDSEFEQFARSAYPALLRTAFALTGDRGHSEDLVQTTLVRVYRRWAEIEAPDQFAYRVLVNLSRDRRRAFSRRPPESARGSAGGRERSLADDGWSPVDGLLDRDMVTGAVVRLPRRMREVIVLRFFLDLSVSETAAALGTSDGTIKAYTARALARMRDQLGDSGTAPSLVGKD